MLKKEFIDFIYQNNIIQLGTVQLKNGDYSDHFYNFGRVDTPDALFHLSKWLVELVADIEFDAVFTSAYKGIVVQTGFALEYGYQYPFKKIRFGYQRKEDKPHGEEGKIVGYQPKKGDRVLLLDDVFTTGYSIEEMVKFLKSNGAIPVLAAVSILSADEKLFSKFKKQIDIPIRYFIHDDEITAVYNQYRGR
jgi:orotate phosphoribosyltransferase